MGKGDTQGIEAKKPGDKKPDDKKPGDKNMVTTKTWKNLVTN
jgi:hypothetical protein